MICLAFTRIYTDLGDERTIEAITIPLNLNIKINLRTEFYSIFIRGSVLNLRETSICLSSKSSRPEPGQTE